MISGGIITLKINQYLVTPLPHNTPVLSDYSEKKNRNYVHIEYNVPPYLKLRLSFSHSRFVTSAAWLSARISVGYPFDFRAFFTALGGYPGGRIHKFGTLILKA